VQAWAKERKKQKKGNGHILGGRSRGYAGDYAVCREGESLIPFQKKKGEKRKRWRRKRKIIAKKGQTKYKNKKKGETKK